MTAPPGRPRCRPDVVRAEEADLDVLSQVIAEAFFDLAPSRWLIPDLAARRQILPGYFRLYVEHALADGLAAPPPAAPPPRCGSPPAKDRLARRTATTRGWPRRPARGPAGSAPSTRRWTITTPPGPPTAG